MPTKTAAKTTTAKSSKPSNKTTIKPKSKGALTAALDKAIEESAVETSAQANGDAQADARAGKSPTLERLDPRGVRYPTFAELTKFNLDAGRVALRTVMPGLVAKHGTPNPSPVDGKRFIVDPVCHREYVSAKAGLVQDMVSKAGLSLHRAPMIHIEAEEQNAMSKTEAASTPDATTTAKPSKAKHETITTTHGEFRKGSVLHAIYRAFELKNGATKAEILERLVKEFPDRTAEDMSSTVNTQINRMPKEREFTLGRSDQGRYGLHIVGVSKARILSPEAAAKLATRQAEKAAKDAKVAEEKAAAAKAKAEKDVVDAQEAAKKSGITVNVPGALVVGNAAPAETAKGKKKKK